MLRKGFINNTTAGISGFGLTNDTIEDFLKQNGLDPSVYDQHEDDMNDHQFLDDVVNGTDVDYFSSADPDQWLLYVPAFMPLNIKQTVPTIAEIKTQLIKVIAKLYQVKAADSEIVTKLVEEYAGPINTGAEYD